jgi:hypothetical protein
MWVLTDDAKGKIKKTHHRNVRKSLLFLLSDHKNSWKECIKA